MTNGEAEELIRKRADNIAWSSEVQLPLGDVILSECTFDIPGSEIMKAIELEGDFEVTISLQGVRTFGSAPRSHSDSIQMGMIEVVSAHYRVEVRPVLPRHES